MKINTLFMKEKHSTHHNTIKHWIFPWRNLYWENSSKMKDYTFLLCKMEKLQCKIWRMGKLTAEL
jgi:hypothetical protein